MTPEKIFAHQCRANPDYYFDECCVSSCKNYSAVIPSKCLAVERKDCLNSDRGISDHEIRFFKNYSSVKQVVRNRKQAFNSVYSIIILDKFIDYINQLQKVFVPQQILLEKDISEVLTKYPLNLPDFNVTPSLLVYLFDEATYNAFSVRTCKMCNEYSLHSILNLDEQSVLALRAKVITYTNGNKL